MRAFWNEPIKYYKMQSFSQKGIKNSIVFKIVILILDFKKFIIVIGTRKTRKTSDGTKIVGNGGRIKGELCCLCVVFFFKN